jgi:hypothetical protein
MSLKGIELQIAIPKTFEAGKIAEQKQQQSQLNQDLAQLQNERESVKNQESVLHSEKYAKTDKDSNKKNGNDIKQNKKYQQNEEEEKTMHPYKGWIVDFTG